MVTTGVYLAYTITARAGGVKGRTRPKHLPFHDTLASKSHGPSGRPRVANQVPDEILNDAKLNLAIEQLPANYNFEIHKTVWSVRKAEARKGASTLLTLCTKVV